MPSQTSHEEGLLHFIEADAPARHRLFESFQAALKTAAREEGTEAARRWALRALQPTLSYSELMSLRRWLVRSEQAPPHVLRLAVLGGPTTTQLTQLVESFLAGLGVNVDVYEAGYGLFRQELLTPGSPLDAFRPQLVFLATSNRDVLRCPRLGDPAQHVERLLDQELADWNSLWEIARNRWQATVIQNTFEIPPIRVMGHYGIRHPAAAETYLERLNLALAASAPPHVLLHDVRALAAEAGASAWFDPRFYFDAKLPCGPDCLVAYAHSVASLIAASRGKSRKVLVLDLDNTLWGDVVGDVGAGGIRLGQGLPDGEAFFAFQQYCKALQERGVVLAVCSKNDEARAREPFTLRTDMALKLTDLSCFIANWNNKVDNLREIARVLELGLDSFVFVDDNPMERAVVRRFLPAVAVPDMPEDPAGFVAALHQHRYFEMTAFTAEDAHRGHHYAEEGARRQLADQAVDIDSFLASLEMRARCEPVGELSLERAVQLVNKSNQFNLTTRRCSVAEMRARASDRAWRTLTVSLRDRVGDSGLISVLILVHEDSRLVVDTWVMSCRVLNRGVETFVLNQLLALARGLGVSQIEGTYVPTPRNGLVRDHYRRLGFAMARSDGETTNWVLTGVDRLDPLPTHVLPEDA